MRVWVRGEKQRRNGGVERDRRKVGKKKRRAKI